MPGHADEGCRVEGGSGGAVAGEPSRRGRASAPAATRRSAHALSEVRRCRRARTRLLGVSMNRQVGVEPARSGALMPAWAGGRSRGRAPGSAPARAARPAPPRPPGRSPSPAPHPSAGQQRDRERLLQADRGAAAVSARRHRAWRRWHRRRARARVVGRDQQGRQAAASARPQLATEPPTRPSTGQAAGEAGDSLMHRIDGRPISSVRWPATRRSRASKRHVVADHDARQLRNAIGTAARQRSEVRCTACSPRPIARSGRCAVRAVDGMKRGRLHASESHESP